MNTYLSAIYLKLAQLDSRHIRLAFMVVAVLFSGGVVMGIPIHGDVGS